MKKQIKKILAVALCVMMILPVSAFPSLAQEATWDGSAASAFAGGNGSFESPYQIANAAQLKLMSNKVNSDNANYGSAHYVLTADIYLNDTANVENWGTQAPANEWVPIGNVDAACFSGSFDGKGYTVYGMYIATAQRHEGLFGYVNGASASSFAEVKNVNVFDGYICGSTQWTAAGVAGWITFARVSGCASDVTIKITGSTAHVCAGGIVGAAQDGAFVIEKCAFNGSIHVETTGTWAMAGGILGGGKDTKTNNGAVKQCCNLGDVYLSTAKGVGGIVGFEGDGNTSGTINISDCYNMGAISKGSGDCGGILGFARTNMSLTNCFNIGMVNGDKQLTGNVYGGAVTFSGNYINSDVSTNFGSGGASGSALTYSGGEFVSEKMSLPESAWSLTEGKMPTLKDVYTFDSDISILGAQIRKNWCVFQKNSETVCEGQGLRFGATLNHFSKYSNTEGTAFADGYSVAIIVSEKSLLGASVLTTATAQNTLSDVSMMSVENGTLTFSAFIVGIGKDKLNTDYAARAVVLKDGAVVEYSDIIERSVSGVAASLGGKLNENGGFDGKLLDVKVLSFNIRAWTDTQTNVTVGSTTYPTVTASKDRELRADAIVKTVLDEAPDSFGLQEFSIEFAAIFDNYNSKWSNYSSKPFAPNLEKYEFADFPGYAAVGKSNENNQWIYNAVFYRTDTWDCIEYGTKWLSDTPDAQGSAYYQTTGAGVTNSGYIDQSRMVTYAVLKNKESGEIYIHYNTHLTIARAFLESQITALQGIIEQTSQGRAYVLTGDMNLKRTWSEYGVMAEAWYDASVCATTTEGVTSSMIDFCFVPKNIYVTVFKNMTEVKVMSEWQNGDTEYWVSDHHPIYMEFKLK